MSISDLWIPCFQNEKEKWHTLVMFPMSIVQDRRHKTNAHVAMGVSDYYNVILTFDKRDILKSLINDVSRFDINALDVHVTFV